MALFKIEKGIPVPRHGKRIYPWKELKVGESFFVDKIQVSYLYNAACHAMRKTKIHFIVRKEKNGARAWRDK